MRCARATSLDINNTSPAMKLVHNNPAPETSHTTRELVRRKAVDGSICVSQVAAPNGTESVLFKRQLSGSAWTELLAVTKCSAVCSWLSYRRKANSPSATLSNQRKLHLHRSAIITIHVACAAQSHRLLRILLIDAWHDVQVLTGIHLIGHKGIAWDNLGHSGACCRSIAQLCSGSVPNSSPDPTWTDRATGCI